MTVSTEKLLRMAEQITANMNYTDDRQAVAANVANHINKFWDERMIAALKSYATSHMEELSPELQAAILQVE